jgi:hypothetical protein
MPRLEKGQQQPKDFPGGHPPEYYPGLARLNFGVWKGSGAFHAVWPLTRNLLFLIASIVPATPLIYGTPVNDRYNSPSTYIHP